VSALAASLRHVDAGDAAELQALEPHGEPRGHKICQVGNVEILQRGDERGLRFANEERSGMEAIVECEPVEPCAISCTPCACDPKMESPSQLGTEYHRVINQQLEPLCKRKSRVLMIGLGGAVLLQYLAKNCPQMSIDAFEINKNVVTAAQNFFGLALTQERAAGRVSVSVLDGAVGLAHLLAKDHSDLRLAAGVAGPGAYDAVVIDCFSGAGKIPEACRSRATLEDARAVLKPHGQLLQNAWDASKTFPEVPEEFAALRADYQEVFQGFQDRHVEMPPSIDIGVHILVGTK
jgi:spermidine synthase